jgi:hypothetical protein
MSNAVGNLNWESSRDEQYVENYWTEHEYTWKLTKRFVSKSVYEVSKDGYIIEYEVPSVERMNPEQFVKNFEQYWILSVQYQKVLKQAKEAGIC